MNGPDLPGRDIETDGSIQQADEDVPSGADYPQCRDHPPSLGKGREESFEYRQEVLVADGLLNDEDDGGCGDDGLPRFGGQESIQYHRVKQGGDEPELDR